MNDDEFGSIKRLKLKYRKRNQVIQTFCKIGSLEKLGPSILICRNFKTLEKYSWIMQNALKSNEWLWIWVHKVFRNEI